jgi:cytochrome b561
MPVTGRVCGTIAGTDAKQRKRVEANEPGYTTTAIALHWVIAILIVALVGIGWYMGDLPRGSTDKRFFEPLHKSLGLLAALMVLVRIAWRAGHVPPPLPQAMPAWERHAVLFSHALLYTCIVVMPLTGYLSGNFDRDPLLFFGLEIPRWSMPDRLLSRLFEQVHSATSNVLVAIVAVHVAAALKHWFIDKDGVSQRMLPGR